jgi:predicted acylesterase/phospholipase RssA
MRGSTPAETREDGGETMTTVERENCDLIMKGGITSGIVYPSAILQLKDKYSFRNIGGASSGAIAAAFAAAAEFGRDTGGFPKLEARRDQLAADGFLKDLLQPSDGTRPLLDIAYAAWMAKTRLEQAHQPGQSQSMTFKALLPVLVELAGRTRPLASARAKLLAIALAGVAALLGVEACRLVLERIGLSGQLRWDVLGLGGLLPALALWYAVTLIGGVLDLVRRFAREVPRNFFGLCMGHSIGNGQGGPLALTDWIHESIQDLAGVAGGVPLTFGDLEAGSVTLRMMTTNLSHNQGYQLPSLSRQPGEYQTSPQATFAFCAEEFDRLFPASVVDGMAVPAARHLGELVLPEGYFALPRGEDLPILVATRMSLSFPVLLSAVPLYTVRRSAVDRLARKKDKSLNLDDLQRNWFSDGGIASNFPIHFFDSWLPRHPTFGIQLTDLPPKGIIASPTGDTTVDQAFVTAVREPGSVKQTDEVPGLDRAVYLPRGDDVIDPEWQPIDGWGDFGLAVFNTLHDAHDNLLSSLPGYRERVVQVRLSSDEGGFNLTMPRDTVRRVMAMGDKAGEKILRYFSMDQHRWVRFRVLMAELERNLATVEERLASRQFDVDELFAAQVAAHWEPDPNNRFPYPRNRKWCDQALEHVRELRALAGCWQSELFGSESPTPEPVLRVVPRE